MKKSLSLLPFILLFLSCYQKQPKERSDEKFQLEATDKGFQVSEYNTWEYFYTGSILNKSGQTYGSGVLFLSVVFEFENGNTVTDMQMNEENRLGALLGLEAVESLGVVGNGQKIKMDKMVSAPIKEVYREYPIKAVYSEFKLKLSDEVNNPKTEKIIKREDITKEWSAFLDTLSN